jgi:hypothetical protein
VTIIAVDRGGEGKGVSTLGLEILDGMDGILAGSVDVTTAAVNGSVMFLVDMTVLAEGGNIVCRKGGFCKCTVMQPPGIVTGRTGASGGEGTAAVVLDRTVISGIGHRYPELGARVLVAVTAVS